MWIVWHIIISLFIYFVFIMFYYNTAVFKKLSFWKDIAILFAATWGPF